MIATAVGCEVPAPAEPTAQAEPRAAPAAPATSSIAPPRDTAPVATAPGQARAPVAVRAPRPEELQRYPWLAAQARVRALDESIAPPPGFRRVDVEAGSFGAWLRTLPLRAPGTPVLTFRKEILRAPDDPDIAAVVELDVGDRDLQQCADSIMRLHAEWLWSAGQPSAIAYPLTQGVASWTAFSQGSRPSFDGARIRWSPKAKPDSSRATFAKYLDVVYGWAGTATMAKHTVKVPRAELRPGDFFIQGGSPGHTVLVLDVAEAADGRKVALLGEGFMPAQDFHVIRPRGGESRPWYPLDVESIQTPYWPAFSWSMLQRLPPGRGPRT